ncbi:MAG TPA: ammonium transporter, partial [Mycobacteriales bacterium]|nr:ammonium transporter [Mycobacteriales bacterium]
MILAAALVLLMTPGLAMFYGGMTRSKSVLNMMMMSFACLAVVPVLWTLYGYTMAFGPTIGNGVVGGFDFLGMEGTIGAFTADDGSGIPVLVFASFQLMFAILTPALISGAIADRAKFGGWVLFVVLWVSLVYFPVCHWVFSLEEGWIAARLGALDFAGGTAVHINAGAAALALTFVLGKRRGFPREAMKPHNLPLVLLGAGLLWFGWYGFNVGSEVAADGVAATVLFNTTVATGAAIIAWLGVEKLRDGHATTLGAASGAIAGLVAITPACNVVSPVGAIVVGLVAGGACAFAVSFKYRLGYDDSLDVVGIHLVGGIVGSLIIGLLASAAVQGEGGVDGLFYGGGLEQLGIQTVAVLAVMAYSFVVSYLLGTLVDKTIGFRITEEQELTGVDETVHAESGYEIGGVGVVDEHLDPHLGHER